MDDYAGRVLADRYRLPLPPSDEYELVETRAFDTYSGQEVLVRQVPLPEVVDAEVLDADGLPTAARRTSGRTVRRSTDPAVRRAIEAAQAAAQVPDHPRLDQVFDVFAEAGSLWIVSELVAARPLAALLAEQPLNPYRAAEIGSDVLTALRVLHAHGWTHRNITVRTVLVCDDGRVVLTGLAAGAAEEALCGYVPVPRADDGDGEEGYGGPAVESGPTGPYTPPAVEAPGPDPRATSALEPGDARPYGPAAAGPGHDDPYGPAAAEPEPEHDDPYGPPELPGSRGPAAIESGPGASPVQPYGAGELESVRRPSPPAPPATVPVPASEAGSAQARAARAGAIAAYRAGARAAARIGEEERRAQADEAQDTGTLPVQRPAHPQPAPGRPGLPAGYDADNPYDEDLYDDEDPYDDEGDDGPPPRRLHLTGSWDDGPGRGRPVPAGGSSEDALRADSRRQGAAPAVRPQLPATTREASPGRWDEIVAEGRDASAYRGPATTLAAERARQARIAVVGAVTERWAPEQAGPVHENWQLAPPIGPSTDLWALGALLYRAVQGHAPYPEENAAELVQMVCGEPPAYAEECGPLRPVVESLLRQDPTERPDFEELRGWLRSLVRSAPEPEAGLDVVTLPSPDATRLPVVRRRGELVRKRRGRRGGAAHGRHRHTKERLEPAERAPRPVREPRNPKPLREPKGPKALRTPPRPQQGEERTPRRLGRLLLVLILLLLAAAVAYAVMFMPKSGSESGAGASPSRTASGAPDPGSPDSGEPSPTRSSGAQQPQTSRSAVALAPGYTLRKDAEGFEIGAPKGWQRSPADANRRIRYGSDGFSLLVVPGRDTVKANGADPLDYQRDKEPELKQFRDSSWASASGLRRIDVGRQAMAEGQFTWQDAEGREVYVRNLVMVVEGRYHILQVIGPEAQRDKVTEIYQQASVSYRVTK
ncbi:protein kinase [Streptomyces sp. NBC_01013]|uniref:protein kinase n=1 Tax=Streptomyces sp. NBC_01013 TaxID=2903718 RepID=UPI0038664E99|nr:protein kinase [Streptomyces sp. NBC_01013]